jgi:hypothetical protein
MAQAARKLRYLNDLGTALTNGDLASSKTALQQAAKAYLITLSDSTASSSSSSTSSGSANIPNDFQSIYDALNNGDMATAKTAWNQLKSDLSDAGVTSLNADALAQQAQLSFKTSTDEAIISTLGTALFSSTSSSTNSLTTSLSNWLTYNATGSSTAATSSLASIFNTQA